MEQTQGNGNDGQRHLNIASGFSVEKVEKFCYLGDTVHADGGADEAVVARIRKGWSNFKELLPFLTDKYITLELRQGAVQSSTVLMTVPSLCKGGGPPPTGRASGWMVKNAPRNPDPRVVKHDTRISHPPYCCSIRHIRQVRTVLDRKRTEINGGAVSTVRVGRHSGDDQPRFICKMVVTRIMMMVW